MALYEAASTGHVQRMALYDIAVRIDFPENKKRYLEYIGLGADNSRTTTTQAEG